MTLAGPIPQLAADAAPTALANRPIEPASVEDAAVRVYEAEVSLHYARQSCVDEWISAAYDHLHLALQAHAEACR